MGKGRQALQKLVLFLIKLYQQCMSPFLGSCCRFYPSCSQYAVEAVKRFGCFKGLYLTTKRILRCHPFSKGGVDNVPNKFKV